MSLAVKRARAGSQGGVGQGTRVRSGDPGLFGGILGAVRGGVGSLLSGGNPIAGAFSGAVSGFSGPPAPGGKGSKPGAPVAVLPAPGVGGAIARFVPGGSTGLVVPPSTAVATTTGHHLNKSSYFLRDGTFVPEGTRMVKNRRRNPLNPRALRKAVGRINAAKGWQSTMSEISTGKYTASGKKKSCS